MRISIRARDDKAQAALRALPDDLKRDVTLALDSGARTMARESKIRSPKAFTGLANSIQSRKLGPMRFEVIAGKNYALGVHEGQKPGHRPAIEAIQKWIKVKGITPHNPLYNIRDLAWFIASSIERKGTKAQPFMREAAEAKKGEIENVIAAGIESALAKAARA